MTDIKQNTNDKPMTFVFLVEMAGTAGTELITYTAKYQIFNSQKSLKLPNYHLKNVRF